MELFTDVPQKGMQSVTAQVMAGLIDVATALGLNSQTCSIHLHNQTPDISAVRKLIDRMVRDAKEIGSSIEKLQRLMMAELDAQGCEFCSAAGSTSHLSSFFEHLSHDMER
jgi:hypothetical protein